ncbi:hypothetical protein AB0M20_09615 [Actinoplanes sp. NPDC051633]|uniref:hypothetical protein n=1 Tax=Actinoplanes sp. NPDC051633 TaxID=3155670 RepID=UPI00342080C2
MAHDAPAFATLATDRDIYVYDRIGVVRAFLTGARLPPPVVDGASPPPTYRGTR